MELQVPIYCLNLIFKFTIVLSLGAIQQALW